jgi:hypothetical protein
MHTIEVPFVVLIDCSLDYFASRIATPRKLKSTYTLSEAVLSALKMLTPGGLAHVYLLVKSLIK